MIRRVAFKKAARLFILLPSNICPEFLYTLPVLQRHKTGAFVFATKRDIADQLSFQLHFLDMPAIRIENGHSAFTMTGYIQIASAVALHAIHTKIIEGGESALAFDIPVLIQVKGPDAALDAFIHI